MNDEVKMPSFRVGKMVRYANWDHARFQPGDQINGNIWFEQFRELYWRRRRDAQAWLDAAKARWSAAAEAGAAFIAATDPALGERLRDGMVTQEDCRVPYYDQIKSAFYSLEHWEWGRDFVVGSWEESSSVYRLNLLPDDKSCPEAASKMVAEILEKLAWFGHVSVGWSCIGHNRARWQTAAVVAWARREHPEWEVEDREYDCLIRK
jgi:hypothetical protein